MKRICKRCGREFEGKPESNSCPECVEAFRHDVMRERTCRTCGKIFWGGPRAWYCPDCRAERRRAADREAKKRRKAGKTRLIGSIDYCANCGAPYVVKGSLQRWCATCSPVMMAKNALIQTKKWNAEHIPPEKRKAERKAQAAAIYCRVCGKRFVPTSAALTCSPECSAELQRMTMQRNEAKNKAKRQAQHRAYYDKKMAAIAAMPPEEQQAYRAEVARRARGNYAKRKARAKAEKEQQNTDSTPAAPGEHEQGRGKTE